MTTYSFVSSSAARPISTLGFDFDLFIRQQPERARICSNRERERRPVDPPPIVQLCIRSKDEESQNYLQNPYLFMCGDLVDALTDGPTQYSPQDSLAGTIVSSLYRLKDVDNTDGGFFIFGDMSIKVEGNFKLKFSLFEIVESTKPATIGVANLEARFMKSVLSQAFQVYPTKAFPGMSQSTFLSRSFSDQGVRIRIRKEHRIQMRQQQNRSTRVISNAQVQSRMREAPPQPLPPQLSNESSMSSTSSRKSAYTPEGSNSSIAELNRGTKRSNSGYHPYAAGNPAPSFLPTAPVYPSSLPASYPTVHPALLYDSVEARNANQWNTKQSVNLAPVSLSVLPDAETASIFEPPRLISTTSTPNLQTAYKSTASSPYIVRTGPLSTPPAIQRPPYYHAQLNTYPRPDSSSSATFDILPRSSRDMEQYAISSPKPFDPSRSMASVDPDRPTDFLSQLRLPPIPPASTLATLTPRSPISRSPFTEL